MSIDKRGEELSVESMMESDKVRPFITVKRISFKRPDEKVDENYDKKTVKKDFAQKDLVNALPDYIRLRPDLRPVVNDEDIVTWSSMTKMPRRKAPYSGNLDSNSTISKDIEERLQHLSEKKRLEKIQALRSFKRGTSPAKFKDYVQ
jgi:hypothetical protein